MSTAVSRHVLTGLWRKGVSRYPAGAIASSTRLVVSPSPRLPNARPRSTLVASLDTNTVTRRAFSQDVRKGGKIWDFEDLQELVDNPNAKVVIVDVREPSELKDTGHIPRAVIIPINSAPDSFLLSDEEFEDRFGYPRPRKDEELVLYCKSGVRSHAAAQLAIEAGWTKVGEYPGSWTDWTRRGGKVER